jgi:hypothetical protein
MSGGTSQCVCDFPKFRSSTSYKCQNQCPTAANIDTDFRQCVTDQNNAKAVEFRFIQPLPLFNESPSALGLET